MGTLFILTGTTKGLGACLAAQIASTEHSDELHLVTLARKQTPQLAVMAAKHHVKLTHIAVDLLKQDELEAAAKQLATLVCATPAGWRLRVLQNAGVVTPILSADKFTNLAAINEAFQVNITAPILLNAHLLSASSHLTDRRMMLISSGAGRAPTGGWGVYCATKAAMDRYAEVVALEYSDKLRITSMAPGIIDTPMQAQIRSTAVTDFPALERFVNLYAQNQLGSPELTAERLLKAFELADYGHKIIDDIRQYTF
jgi:NAD(P)-dependent dehydrogenase (short-subunit alcohol dehydrogenase family)